jgi:hypothetical protein
MQSNTAAVENQPINFPSFSVEKKTCKSDPFTIKDGRYVGGDGFVVPRDFEEFFERFPDYVRRWVSKHADRSAPKEDLEDHSQDLLIHLLNLPQTSKYREAGKKDIVQTFDPVKHYGANEARFRNYINLCLANKLKTFYSKSSKDALFRPGNLSLGAQMEGEDLALWMTNTAIRIRLACSGRRMHPRNRLGIERILRSSWISCGGKTRKFYPR